MDINLLWFFLIGVLLTGYAILDGFDLGVGTLHIFAPTDRDRRIVMNSIGPVWDGNEVWLVTAGGALFAAFPNAYAAAFSGFYLAFMFLLCALIFRAVALEFRSKLDHRLWRGFWDWAFAISSATSSLLFGVAVGNMIQGIKIGPDMEYHGTLLDLLKFYPLLVGVFNLVMFAMHGAIYLHLKTEGELQERVRGWIWKLFVAFVILYAFTTIVTLIEIPNATRHFRTEKWLWSVVLLNVLAIANIPRTLYLRQPLFTFLSSAATVAALIALMGIALFPNLIVSTMGPQYNLTAYNAASSQKTLAIMRNIALIGMPFVISYTAAIYWIFRGKVELGKFSY